MPIIKICFDSDIRRLSSEDVTDFTFLEQRVAASFGLASFRLTYADDEQDVVTISNDADLAEAVSIAQDEARKSLRITVSSKDQRVEPQVDLGAVLGPLLQELPKLQAAAMNPCARGKGRYGRGRCGRGKRFGRGCGRGGRGVVHRHVTCDGCGVGPIRGLRFKCAVCPDFDFCDACEGKMPHDPSHVFLQIRAPTQAPAAVRVTVHKPVTEKNVHKPVTEKNEEPPTGVAECKSGDEEAPSPAEQPQPNSAADLSVAESVEALAAEVQSGKAGLEDILRVGPSLLQRVFSEPDQIQGLMARFQQPAQPSTSSWEVSDLDRAIAASMEDSESSAQDCGSTQGPPAVKADAVAEAAAELFVDADAVVEATAVAEADAVAEAAAELFVENSSEADFEVVSAQEAETVAEAAAVAEADAAAEADAVAEADAAAEAVSAEPEPLEAAGIPEAAEVGKWDAQLRALAAMGFSDTEALTFLLEQHNGDLLPVIETLFA